MGNYRKHIWTTLLAVAALIAGSSCSMMHEDLSDCPTGLYVRFVYDYNTARADLWKDHAGYVRLLVFDEKGDLAAVKEVSNSDEAQPLSVYGYAIHFEDGELAPGSYRLQAIGLQKDWDSALQTKGAKYRTNSPARHDELLVHLDHADEPLPGTDRHPVSDEAPLDTLWHTLKVMSIPPRDGADIPAPMPTTKPYSVYPLEDQYVTVAEGLATFATVSMIRDTKHINIVLHQIDDPADINHNDFDINISDCNKSLAHDNAPASDTRLHYTPYKSWTTAFGSDGSVIEDGTTRSGEVTQRTAHFNLMTNRLIHSNDFSNAAQLLVTDKKTGNNVVNINLPSMLAEGRIAYDYGYSSQEYLDREYDYHLHFFLKGDKWIYCDISINVLSWAMRIENAEL